jgi:hypothetical protein
MSYMPCTAQVARIAAQKGFRVLPEPFDDVDVDGAHSRPCHVRDVAECTERDLDVGLDAAAGVNDQPESACCIRLPSP